MTNLSNIHGGSIKPEETQLCPDCGESIGFACWCRLPLENKQRAIELLQQLAELRSKKEAVA